MLLFEYFSFPTSAPVEITDEQLRRIPQGELHTAIPELLKEVRAGPTYQQLRRIWKECDDRIRDAAQSAGTVEGHIAGKKTLERWRAMEARVTHQLKYHRDRVVITTGEYNDLVTRWILLFFGDVEAENQKKQLDEGVEVVGGIIQPKAGGVKRAS